jgi:ABC-type branched-subunit amino acid transport system substrate-binding protein
MPVRRLFSAIIPVLLILAFISALTSQGCAPSLPPEPDWEKDARTMLDQAEGFYAKRQYDQAAKTADSVLVRYPKSRHGDRAFYLLGEIRLTQRDYRQAFSYYKEVIEKYPASPLIPQAKYKLGRCCFELREYDLAIANLEDRSRITDPAQLRNISEMLSYAYLAKKNYPAAVREYLYLAANNANEKQQAGYRDRIREIIDKSMSEDELKALAAGTAYPADLAQLRLASMLVQQRSYRDAVKVSKDFLDRFPNHPERTRAEMLFNEASTGLTLPRYFVGALVPQTGQLAFFGDRVLKGIQLAVLTYNQQNADNRVELVVKDTEGVADKAVAGMNELASKNIVAAVGPVTTREEEGLAPVLDNLHIPVIRPTASRSGFSFKSSWIFRNALTIDSQARAAAEYAAAMKLKRFVIFYPDEPYGKDLYHLFIKDLERKAEILASIAYPPDTKDFGPYIRRVMEIDFRSRKIIIPEDEAERKKLFAEYTPGFDALYLPGSADRVGLLIPQLAFYNITDRAMLGSDNWHSQDLIERAGRYADGAVFFDGFFPESTDPAIKAFVDAYRSAYHEEPDILSAQAYDAAMMIFSQLKQGKENPAAIGDGLLAVKDYPGVSGSATFDGSWEARKKLFLIKIEDDKFTLVNTGK